MSQIQVTGEAKIRDLQGPVVANSGVITALDGLPSQYVRGDGTLADIPSVTGGGASVSYYLNGSVNQGTFGGSTYYELGENAITGVGTNFSTSTDGLLAQFITDAGVPDVTEIPSGNWNIEFYMGVSASSGALASFYVDIFKYDGTTFTLIGSNSSTPDFLTNTTTVDAYFTSVAMPLTAMAETDRIAIRVYANVAGKTVTLYTEDNRLCQVVTTFSRGMLSLNNLTDQQQYLTVGTAGTDFNIVSSVDTHTFNIPSASATNRGLITTGTQSIGGVKTFLSSTIQEGLSVLKNDAFQVIPSGYTALTGYGLGGLTILQGDGTNVYNTDLDFPNTSNRQYTFPDITGTVALLQGTQTFTGSKTFTGLNTFANDIIIDSGVSGNTLSFKQYSSGVTGGVGYTSLYAQGSDTLGINFGNIEEVLLSNSLLTTIRQYQFPDLSGTFALLEGSQTFTGEKVFNNNALFNSVLSVNYGAWLQKGTPTATFSSAFTTLYSEVGAINAVFRDNTNQAKLQFQAASNYTYTFPASSGTVALTSNLSAYVPYSGATGSVNLGIYTLNAGNIDVNGISTSGGAIRLKQNGIINTGPIGYTTLSSAGAGLLDIYFGDSNLYSVELTNNLLTANRVYNFPNASGTLALTSNLSAYLPLTGGTLTGNLTIAKSDTLNVLTLSSTNSNVISFITSSVQKGEISVNASNFQFNSFTTNGYIFKNSAANNVLSITDAGVTTLIGALSGTSATFSGNVTIDTNTLFVDSTNNRVGVGTITPQTPVDIRGQVSIGFNAARTAGTALVLTGATDNTTNVSISTNTFGSGVSLVLGTGGTPNTLTLANSGAATFSSSVTAKSLKIENTSAASFLYFNNTAIPASNYIALGSAANDLYFQVNGSDRMVIKDNGNVGIGTSSPPNTLTIQNAGENSIEWHRSNAMQGMIGIPFSSNQIITGSVQNDFCFRATSKMLFATGGDTERMRITSDAKILMGTTTYGGVGNSFDNGGGIIVNYSGTGFRTAVEFKNNNGTIGSITCNGSSTTYNTTSDYRLKEDLKEIKGLEKVSAIKVYDFKWKGIDDRMDGVLAHELADIIPYAVQGQKDDEQMQSVDYSKLVPILIKSIQELQAKIVTLESKIN